ncbi:MAG: hypothetical protein LBB88_00255 [Planctomycetaceae bacterium]|nr:hypothetical protein [Planctomycetaceae bacterium]
MSNVSTKLFCEESELSLLLRKYLIPNCSTTYRKPFSSGLHFGAKRSSIAQPTSILSPSGVSGFVI